MNPTKMSEKVKWSFSPDIEEARRFLEFLSPGEEEHCFQTFDEDSERKAENYRAWMASGKKGKADPFAFTLHGTLKQNRARLTHLNRQGAGVYVAVNKVKPGAARKNTNVIAVRAAFTDHDDNGSVTIRPVKEANPAPAVVNETSPGKFHAFWPVIDCHIRQFTPLQEALAEKFNTDRGVKDRARVVRLPGFFHTKMEKGVLKNPGPDGLPFMSRTILLEESPTPRQTDEIIKGLGLSLTGETVKPPKMGVESDSKGQDLVPEKERHNVMLQDILPFLHNAGLTGEALVAVALSQAQARFDLNTPGNPFGEEEVRGLCAWFDSRESAAEQCNCTDRGNSRRLARMFGHKIRFCKQLGWMVYDGKRWAPDDLSIVQKHAKEIALAVYGEAAREPDEAKRKALAKWALLSESAARIAAMQLLLASEPGISVLHSVFDADPMLFNCANGTIDLRTGELRPHDPENLITKLSPVQYDCNAQGIRFEQFTMEIMDGDDAMVGLLQRLIGYALTGLTWEQIWVILIGQGWNGKTTLMGAIEHVLGDYYMTADPRTFLETKFGGESRPDLAELKGARFIATSEPDPKKIDAAMVKRLAGEDTIRARHLYRDGMNFKPTGKLFFSTNHRPMVRDNSEGFWRKLLMLEFPVSFKGNRRDGKLDQKLKAEASGVLAWMVRGCLAWQSQGLNPPASVAEAVIDYRESTDILAEFLKARCALGRGNKISVASLYDNYIDFCDQKNIKRPLSRQKFNEDLRGRDGIRQTKDGPRDDRVRVWIGIGLPVSSEGENVVKGDFGNKEPCPDCALSEKTPHGNSLCQIPVRRQQGCDLYREAEAQLPL